MASSALLEDPARSQTEAAGLGIPPMIGALVADQLEPMAELLGERLADLDPEAADRFLVRLSVACLLARSEGAPDVHLAGAGVVEVFRELDDHADAEGGA